MLTALPGSDQELIDSRVFMLLCILWCSGSQYEKAGALTWIINFSGEHKEAMTKDDPELDYTIETLFYLATSFTWNMNEVRYDE